jgi:hypothetical protein
VEISPVYKFEPHSLYNAPKIFSNDATRQSLHAFSRRNMLKEGLPPALEPRSFLYGQRSEKHVEAPRQAFESGRRKRQQWFRRQKYLTTKTKY